MRFRLIRGVFNLVVGLVVVAVIGVGWLFYRAMPEYSGRAALPGASAEIRVWRDSYAVPHIFADNADDAARALGWLHASERLYQMEIERRAGHGRLAEIVGPDLLGVDKFIRALGFSQLAQSSLAALSPQARSRLDAYAQGVNAWLDAHPGALPPEFLLLGDTPEPWKPEDSLVIAKLQSLQLSRNYKIELMRAQVARKLPPEQAAWIFPDLTLHSPVTTEPATPDTHADASPERMLDRIAPWAHGASNEWAIAGSRTASGKPILANDPHLSLDAPILWYLARIVTPQGTVKGVSIPGTPAILLGQNDRIAWGLTTAMTDTQDLFIETIDPANPNQYLTPVGPKPFLARDETIHVKGAADVVLHARATRHGPVLSDLNKAMAEVAGDGKVMALAFTGLDDKDTTTEAVIRLNAAKNWNEFSDALRLFKTPTQNIAYADVDGDIGFISPGLVPVRKSGDGLTPTDGASGATDWTGFVPFEQLPQAHNPQAGFLFNANNADVPPAKEGMFGRDWEEPFRARRIQAFMDSPDKQTPDQSARMQMDHLTLAGLALKPILAKVTPSDERARQALQLVASWNGETDANRPEPLIADVFLYELHRMLLTDRLGVAFDDEFGPFDATTVLSLVTEHPAFCDTPSAPDPDCHATLSRAFDAALGFIVKRDGADMSQWKWGQEHVALINHRVYSHIPLLDRLTDLSFPSSGDFYTLDRGNGFDAPADLPLARTQAAGYRGVFDLANPDQSRFIIATGQSGHIFSAHYRDLLPLWRDGKSITLSGAEADLEKAGAKEFVFAPK